MMKKAVIILAIAVGLTVLAFAANYFNKDQSLKTIEALKIGAVTFNVEVADTDAKRTQGLSGREGLAEDQGMLFVFDKEGYYGFWMKDMKFPVDMIWLSKDKKVTHIENDVSPQTYPEVFNSPAPSLYVLEVSAGFSAKNNIQVGELVAF